jgi:hypothetical protein
MMVMVAAAIALAACGDRGSGNAVDTNVDLNAITAGPSPSTNEAVNAATENTAVANKAEPLPPPLAEPKGPIDPKSAEAAGQVVQHYGALIEQGRWSESWQLWSDPAAARQFDRNWRDDSEVHLEIGDLRDPEGAAGSIYISEPVTFYGKTKDGASFRRAAEVTLRRVNDVPGSTAEQRRWHIARIELK